MRLELALREGKRQTYFATFVRYGRRKGWKGREETTLLFSDIRDSLGTQVSDHLWFGQTKAMLELGPLLAGTQVKFEARSAPYEKGYKGYRDVDAPVETDFKLAFPTHVELVENSRTGNQLLLL